jgi:hypothetical protein
MILYALLLRQASLCSNCNCLVCSFCHETTRYLTVQVLYGRIGSVLSLDNVMFIPVCGWVTEILDPGFGSASKKFCILT